MKLIPITLFITLASAGRLENTYLPPTRAKFSGGSEGLITTPSLNYRNPLSQFNQGIHVTAPSLGGISNPSTYLPPLTPINSFATLIPIIRLNNDNNGDGNYKYDYETANHIAARESGRLKNADTSEVQGSFSYQAPNGQVISLSYIADENGYRAVGDHLPISPPVPDSILKSGFNGDRVHLTDPSRQYLSSVSNQYLPPIGR